MQYLCLKQLTAAGTTYYPGDTVPDGVILPERGVVLVGSRYLAEVDEAALQEGAVIFPKDGIPVDREFYTREQVEQMIADAVAEAVRKQEEQMKGLRGYAAELKEISPDVMGSAVPISVHMEGSGENGQMMSLLVEQQEIQQAFSIMQMNVEDGAKAMTASTCLSYYMRQTVAQQSKMRPKNRQINYSLPTGLKTNPAAAKRLLAITQRELIPNVERRIYL